MWLKKEVEYDNLEGIIYKNIEYPYEYQIVIKEKPRGCCKVMWMISSFKSHNKISRTQCCYSSKNQEKNKTRAEYAANILKSKIVNENPLKYGKKLLLNNLKWL